MRLLGVLAFLAACPALAHASGPDEVGLDARIDAGDYVEALSLSVDLFGERLARSGPRSPETLDALRRVGITLRKMGDLELADAVWRIYNDAAYEIAGPCDPRVAEAICQIGATTRGVSSNYDDVLPHYVEALSLLDPGDRNQSGLVGQILRGEANYFRYRDKVRSLELFESALSTLECTLPQSARECAETRVWLGWTLLHMGRHDEARLQLEQARDDLNALGLAEHDLAGTVESALADLDALAGRWEDAEDGYVRATRLFTRARRNGSTRFAEFPLHGYNLLALTQLKQGRPDEAWESLQRYRSPAGKRLGSLREWRERSPESYAAVVEARRAVLEQRSLRRQRIHRGSVSAIDWNAVLDELKANARLCELEARYYGPLVSGGVSLRELQATLPDDGAYIGWLDARVGNELLCSTGPILDSRWIYVVRSHGPVHWIPLWEHRDVASLNADRQPTADFSVMLERAAAWTLRVEDDRELAKIARRVSVQEFDAALPYLRDVHQTVFEYFEDETGWRPIEGLELADGQYLGERFTVSYSPSADVFVAARKRAIDPPGKRPVVVAIGDAVFSDNPNQPPAATGSINVALHRSALNRAQHRAATNGDPEALARLPRLPYAAAELNRIGDLFPGAIVLREKDASEANVEKLFMTSGTAPAQRIDILHVATHALSETPLRQRCAVALSRGDVGSSPSNDGLVDALEIQLGWELDADLVCLSGCQTASGPGWFRGEPMGLSTVLLGVGAKSVVASMWKVDDLATALLMGRFYENLSGKYAGVRAGAAGITMSKAAALAEAKRWLRRYTDTDGRTPFAHPVYWAGFILIGDPG